MEELEATDSLVTPNLNVFIQKIYVLKNKKNQNDNHSKDDNQNVMKDVSKFSPRNTSTPGT